MILENISWRNNISYTKERSAKYLYSYPIGSTPSVLVVSKDSDITSYDDIAGHSTRLSKNNNGCSVENIILKTVANKLHQWYYLPTNLNEGKFDFKIFDAPTVNTIIKNQKLNNLKTIELKSDEQPFIYFIFGQDQKDLQSFVNKRLKTLQKDGTLSDLAQKYLGGDYVPNAKDLTVPSEK